MIVLDEVGYLLDLIVWVLQMVVKFDNLWEFSLNYTGQAFQDLFTCVEHDIWLFPDPN